MTEKAIQTALETPKGWLPMECAPEELWNLAHMDVVRPRLGELTSKILMLSDGSRCAVEWGNPASKPQRFFVLPDSTQGAR